LPDYFLAITFAGLSLMRLFFLVSLIVFLFGRPSRAQVTDSIALPFAIAKEKRLSDEDLINKKEGTYITGVPDLSSDPINGFGYGVEASIFFNGKKSDPFFAYTPYRASIDVVLFNTTRSQREALVVLDIPYVFNSPWRLRFEGGYESNPNLLYFGNTDQSLNGLNYYAHGDSSLMPRQNVQYSDYEENALTGNSKFYNTYNKNEYILNISGERSYMEGKLRLLIGYELAWLNISTFKGNSFLQNDFDHHKALGVGKSLVGIVQSGLIYDTRDLETDPGKGVFAELTNELSLKSLGSSFDFNKTFAHFNLYHNLSKNKKKKIVLAIRIAGGYTAGPSPFFEYQDQWSSEGSIEGLGGPNTLRGFKQSRFLNRVMTFNNLELRCRLFQAKVFKQHVAMSVVPFLDAGGVWQKMTSITQFNHYRFSEGLGLRWAWNVNTILRFDYAISKEDKQFFFNLAHAF
jgi:outer membrane protein assembly factor BamA